MKLREWMYQSRLTAKKVAEILEVTREHVSNMLGGRCGPSKKLLKRISEITRGEVSVKEDVKDD